jgi:hypothetical protein
VVVELITSSELATYHTSSASSIATYMITGEVPPIKRMDVDDGEDEYDFDEEDEEDMPEMKIVLVGEDKLACGSLRLPFCCGSV